MENQPRKALIRLGSPCNNRCVFCHGAAARAQSLTTAQAMTKIRAAAERGADMVVFSGGEPTIRKDLMDLIAHARQCGLEAGIITNGRMLCYENFASALLEIGLGYMLVSLHGHDEQTHNLLTGTQGFAQTLAGLRRIAGRVDRLVVNTVLMRSNAGHLEKIERLLEPLAPVFFKISLPEPKGAILDNPGHLLAPAHAAAEIARFLERRAGLPGMTVGVDGVTPCLFPQFFEMNDDFFTHGFRMISEPDEYDFYPPDHGDRVLAQSCTACSHYHLCPGIHRKYFDMFPDLELRPVSGRVRTDIRYEKTACFRAGSPAQACAALKPLREDTARAIAVKSGGVLAVYRAVDSQVTEPELLRLKFELEQVYARDGAGRGRGSKLSLMARCRACPQPRTCPGVFVRASKQPYAELDGTLRAIENAAREGNALALQDMNAIEPRKQNQGLILLKYSYHGMPDLERGMAALAAVCAPGARVLVAERVRRIVIEDALQCALYGDDESGPVCRIHSADNAAGVFNRHGFRTVSTHEVQPCAANHWTAEFEKI
jgi:uncharacterized Fe-S cluster-containing radical SAM superfamily protein